MSCDVGWLFAPFHRMKRKVVDRRDYVEYECGIGGHRFTRNNMNCPYCGVRFNTVKKDEEEWYEEFDEECAWDEEEGW